MKKNVSGQKIGAQMITATDGSEFSGSVTVAVTIDAGTQATGSVGSGACTSEGHGYYTYAPAQAETNGDLLAFTFYGTGAITATVQIFTSFPQSVDNATDITAIKTKTDFLPSATAGAAGGLFIAGTNAPVTITGSGNALTLASTGGNGHGLAASGNGVGNGTNSVGGATGKGGRYMGGSSSGVGLEAVAQAGGDVGFLATVSSGTAPGAWFFGGTNSPGLLTQGQGSGAGHKSLGGSTGHGVLGIGGSSSGDGMHLNSQAGNSDGLECVGDGSGFDINADLQGTISGTVNADVIKISGDTTAADNAESFFDGTGYAGTNNVIPLVTVTTTATTAGALGATAKADVNAEVLDVINVDTYGEPGQEAPGATVSLAKKINYLYKFLRNKVTQTSTTLKVYADDGSTVDQKSTVSDDGTTYTRGEIGTGP